MGMNLAVSNPTAAYDDNQVQMHLTAVLNTSLKDYFGEATKQTKNNSFSLGHFTEARVFFDVFRIILLSNQPQFLRF